MPAQPFSPQQLSDGLLTFEKGVNHGIAPELVPRNQLFEAINTSVRGDFVHPRPPFQKRMLVFDTPAVQTALNAAWVQAACYYKPDLGNECLMLAAGGRLYRFEILADRAIVTDVTGANAQSATATQEWLWQSEKWVVWNDGVSNPVFYDGSVTARSNFGTPTTYYAQNGADFTIPQIGQTVNITYAQSLAPNPVGNLNPGNDARVDDKITVRGTGYFTVVDVSANPVIKCIATDVKYPGTISKSGWGISWTRYGDNTQLPPGRIGTYGMGRNCMVLTDGKQFLISDAVGGSSGTQPNNFRDAVLNITENTFLAGGGTFTVPGSFGEIQAMRFAAVLDAALGQGPLQVFTRKNVFSCQTPTDRLTWQDVTNPILSESLIGGGATGQDSTQLANGDTIMRSLVGLTSLILGRRDVTSNWGITPISHEIDPTPAKDSQDLLPWASSIVFDNRYLVTMGTVLGPHGPYFKAISPINFDTLSTLRGKQPAVYDARLWTGLNIYKMLVGDFNKVNRAFAFGFNAITDELELYELFHEEQSQIADNGTTPIQWTIESGVLDFGELDPRTHHYKRLQPAEIWIDDLQGTAEFMVWWKPDQWPAWVPWARWSECAVIGPDSLPQFRPRMPLPEPSGAFCDPSTNRPLREGYIFRVRIQITGHCTFKGAKFNAITVPSPQFGAPICAAICP